MASTLTEEEWNNFARAIMQDLSTEEFDKSNDDSNLTIKVGNNDNELETGYSRTKRK